MSAPVVDVGGLNPSSESDHSNDSEKSDINLLSKLLKDIFLEGYIPTSFIVPAQSTGRTALYITKYFIVLLSVYISVPPNSTGTL